MQRSITLTLLLFLTFSSFAQDTLSLENAIALALENNYGIKVARNNVQISNNNATLGNAGLLPTINVNGGGNYSNVNTRLRFGDPTMPEVRASGVQARNMNASVGLNYVIFDGLGTIYNYKSLVAQNVQSEVQARLNIENTIAVVANTYYQLGMAQQAYLIAYEALRISDERLKRQEIKREYGTAVTVDILNARVDKNADSVNFVNARLNLENTRRELNFLLGGDIETVYAVESKLQFRDNFNLENLKKEAEAQNAELLSARYNQTISELNYKVARANYFPTLSLNGNYNFNREDREVGLLLLNQNYGFTGGATLAWNLFNGSRQQIRVQNAKINIENSRNLLEQAQLRLEKDLLNAWNTYQKAIYIYNIEIANLTTAKANFERTRELFNIGTVSTTQFREAQLNFLRSQNSIVNATYTAKMAEIELLRLSGQILR